MIRIKNLSKKYNNNEVLKNLNNDFFCNKIYGIIGANGSGKTTLFNCILGLEKFNGSITSEYNVLKNHIGFLPTSPYYISKLTGKEYIQLLANSRGIKIKDYNDINIFDLPYEKYAANYSTGMKKN